MPASALASSVPAPSYPITASAALYDPNQVEEYFAMLFRNVDWQDGQVISVLGIGEKGTPQEGVFRERQIVPPAFVGLAHKHLKRWAGHEVAGFIVPAVLHAAAQDKGDVTLDKVAALTAILLDIDSGDVTAKAKFVTERLGKPSMTVASGGMTEEGKLKAHLYWLFNEPCEDVERVAAMRKALAAKTGGDQSFGRATQVVRVPGSVHAKHGKASVCRILDRSDAEYSFDDLADIIENMQPMPGLPAPTSAINAQVAGGTMDFSPRQDTALVAMHRDINEGGEDLTRWGEFSKVAGFNISEARAGRLTPEAAYAATSGWVLSHMVPPWPQARIDQEFRGLVNKDVAGHGPLPAPPAPWSNVAISEELPLEYFSDIKASLKNAWLVRDLFPLPGLGLIYGSPGSGKSFLALDIALRIAAGWQIDGRAVKQRPVIYIAAEGQNGLRGRVAAFRQHHSVESDLPFAMVPCVVNLLDPNADIPRLIKKINEAATRFGQKPGLIVVDTLAATFAGGDENTTAMVAYVNNLANLRDTFGSAVVAVHHRPKDQLNDTPRGHGSLMGAMDTILRVEAGELRIVSVTKQKDAEAGASIVFGLKSIILGVDDEGEPVTSAVVEYLKASTCVKLSKAAGAALQALTDAITSAEVPSVSEGAWRAVWMAALPDTMEEEARRKAWTRNRDRLKLLGRVRCEAGEWSPVAATEPTATMDFSPKVGA